ncbi:sigma-70 family RNA polymerase sigma factor [Hominisplanchenecus murintestinalis]|uniref:Sigma-70 family RNA polymerase sigma factor n=1 Tax=Hominisplanchenecus murintestinalis TaxID=2941517 RepID=A0AC61QVT4_9FIRM|nr:sigma-70 family RNA polymerase sigma factor [Hominisplanchenecus murintestinalis]TGX96766.1 sigma-70 family RNA polymerase sigma factor [Hominisplanchenecus murintestinalis]
MPKYAELPAFREQNFIMEADGDMLHREARALAIRRIEESARTEADFENVLYWWDKLDANRERKERDHETGRSTVPLEWGADKLYLSDKPSYDMILRRLLLAGDFLDIIFDHPETIHELVVDADLSKILKEQKPHLKNMLYYLFLRDYSTSEYAESIRQSDRNIRGIRETALKKIRKLYGGILTYRQENNLPMTLDEKYFLENGVRKKKGKYMYPN